MTGSKTQTENAPAEESPTEHDTVATEIDDGSTPETTTDSSNTDQPSTTPHDETTATDGPGFGVLAGITSRAIAAARFRRH